MWSEEALPVFLPFGGMHRYGMNGHMQSRCPMGFLSPTVYNGLQQPSSSGVASRSHRLYLLHLLFRVEVHLLDVIKGVCGFLYSCVCDASCTRCHEVFGCASYFTFHFSWAYVMFDTSASYSFISFCFASMLKLPMEWIYSPLLVDTPGGIRLLLIACVGGVRSLLWSMHLCMILWCFTCLSLISLVVWIGWQIVVPLLIANSVR